MPRCIDNFIASLLKEQPAAERCMSISLDGEEHSGILSSSETHSIPQHHPKHSRGSVTATPSTSSETDSTHFCHTEFVLLNQRMLLQDWTTVDLVNTINNIIHEINECCDDKHDQNEGMKILAQLEGLIAMIDTCYD